MLRGFLAFLIVASGVAPVSAQRTRVRTRVAEEARLPGHIVLVVESEDSDVRGEDVRAAVTRAGITAIGLTDERAASARATVSLVIPAHGRTARVVFVRGAERRLHYIHAGAGAHDRWMVSPVVTFLREALMRPPPAAPPAVVPPEAAVASAIELQPPSEVLNPWGPVLARRDPESMLLGAMLAVEVLNPWAEGGPRPVARPAFAHYVAGEVLDPWAIDGSLEEWREPEDVERGDVVDPWTRLEGADALAAPADR